FLSNSISENTHISIDRGPEAINVGDPGYGDDGANLLQNAPTLVLASNTDSATDVTGTINTNPNTTVRIQLFASVACDPSGFGEGDTYLGEMSVVTNSSGDAAVSFTTNQRLATGTSVTATATGPLGDTSEFSNCVTVASPADVAVTASAMPATATTGTNVTFDYAVRDLGPNAAHSTVIVVHVTAGSTFVSASSSAGSCTTPPVGGVGDVTCNLGDLSVGSTSTVSVTVLVTATAPSTVVSSADAASVDVDPDVSNNSASVAVDIVPGIDPPVIENVVKLTGPFRLKLVGTNFQPGVRVFIGDDGQPWQSIRYSSVTSITLKKGRNLAVRFPRGIGVAIRVVNADGGEATTVYVR
ncbi:MAG TPA: DUF11 domain-containing protein, partial [Blastocatellia bacterium]|nr:DUF11 domain-containing protein [Blastocatellia bacterium]